MEVLTHTGVCVLWRSTSTYVQAKMVWVMRCDDAGMTLLTSSYELLDGQTRESDLLDPSVVLKLESDSAKLELLELKYELLELKHEIKPKLTHSL